jgi:hypothetical protein
VTITEIFHPPVTDRVTPAASGRLQEDPAGSLPPTGRAALVRPPAGPAASGRLQEDPAASPLRAGRAALARPPAGPAVSGPLQEDPAASPLRAGRAGRLRQRLLASPQEGKASPPRIAAPCGGRLRGEGRARGEAPWPS